MSVLQRGTSGLPPRAAGPGIRSPRCLRGLALPALLALALVCAPACDDEDPESGEGLQIDLETTPNPVHLVVDSTGTSTIDALLADLDDNPVAGATIEFETNAGALSAPSAVTDGSGMASVTFTSVDTPVTATITATHANLVGITIINVFEEDIGDHTLSPTTATITACSGTGSSVPLSGIVEDANAGGIAMSGVNVTFSIVSTDVDGTATPLGGSFDAASATTNGFGEYTVTFTPTEADCTANCVGIPMPECHWILQAGASAPNSPMHPPATPLSSNTVTVTETVP